MKRWLIYPPRREQEELQRTWEHEDGVMWMIDQLGSQVVLPSAVLPSVLSEIGVQSGSHPSDLTDHSPVWSWTLPSSGLCAQSLFLKTSQFYHLAPHSSAHYVLLTFTQTSSADLFCPKFPMWLRYLSLFFFLFLGNHLEMDSNWKLTSLGILWNHYFPIFVNATSFPPSISGYTRNNVSW